MRFFLILSLSLSLIACDKVEQVLVGLTGGTFPDVGESYSVKNDSESAYSVYSVVSNETAEEGDSENSDAPEASEEFVTNVGVGECVTVYEKWFPLNFKQVNEEGEVVSDRTADEATNVTLRDDWFNVWDWASFSLWYDDEDPCAVEAEEVSDEEAEATEEQA